MLHISETFPAAGISTVSLHELGEENLEWIFQAILTGRAIPGELNPTDSTIRLYTTFWFANNILFHPFSSSTSQFDKSYFFACGDFQIFWEFFVPSKDF